MAKASVLVVEDNPMSRATAVDMFIVSGSQCSRPTTGTTLWRCLRATEISLFFVDVRMPGMSGPELAELVRHRRPDIKIVLPRATLARNSCQATFTSYPSLGAWTRLPKRLPDIGKDLGAGTVKVIWNANATLKTPQ